MPGETLISTLPEMTACWVSPPPEVMLLEDAGAHADLGDGGIP